MKHVKRGTAAYKLERAARVFRSVARAKGDRVSSTNRQGKGVPLAFSTNRQGKSGLRSSGIRATGIRGSAGRVLAIREFLPRDKEVQDGSRFASSRVMKKLGIRAARGTYYLVSPTGDRALAVPGKYLLEDGSVLVV